MLKKSKERAADARLKGTEKFLKRWISKLVRAELFKKSFDQWMSGFEDRYSQAQLEFMRKTWLGRQERMRRSRARKARVRRLLGRIKRLAKPKKGAQG